MGRVRRTGDEKAFDELYRRYARRLHGFFFRMLGREEQLAADFTQELFLRVWAARGRYECGRELCPWFFTMAYNLCRNEYRFRNIAVGFAEEVRGGPETYEEQTELRMDVRMFDRDFPHCWTSCLRNNVCCLLCVMKRNLRCRNWLG